MTSIRRFVFAAALAATTFNLVPSLATAQEPARGKFKLTHDVRWGNARIPAGDYTFNYNLEGVSPVLVLSKMSGTPASFMVLVPSTEQSGKSTDSRILLETTRDGSYVSAMQLPDFGMTLHFSVPAHASDKQLAKAALTASASGQ